VLATHHAQDEAVNASVRDQQVGARAEKQVRDLPLPGALENLLDGFGPRHLEEEFRRTSDAE